MKMKTMMMTEILDSLQTFFALLSPKDRPFREMLGSFVKIRDFLRIHGPTKMGL